MYRLFLSCLLLFIISRPSLAEKHLIVAHNDKIVVQKNLSLAQLVNLTFEKHPDGVWLQALEEEAIALSKRSESWTAGAAQATMGYQEATSGTLHIMDAGVQVPLWNLGQRDAEHKVGVQADESAQTQAAALKLRIAGLVRAALWEMDLQKTRYEQAKIELDTFQELLEKTQRRVALGDLPRMDELLVQTELLQKRSALTLAEAELMHARKRYISITQTNHIPADYHEHLVALQEIEQTHPALVALASQIERKQAELDAQRLVGSGQTALAIGINSDRASKHDPRSNNTESFNLGISIPFGGEAHLAPQLAAINLELSKLLSERAQLYRDLEQAHHEAEHNLAVNQAEMKTAQALKQAAQQHFKMTQLSYAAGEINLLDLLKVQARTQQTVLNAKERALMIERDKALYNQAVGVLP